MCIRRSENIKPRLNKRCSFLKRQLFANESIYIPQTFSTDTAIPHAGLGCRFPYRTHEGRSENTFTWHAISQLKEPTLTDVISVTSVAERSPSVSGAEVKTVGHELKGHRDVERVVTRWLTNTRHGLQSACDRQYRPRVLWISQPWPRLCAKVVKYQYN
jgi:hypothetical protein